MAVTPFAFHTPIEAGKLETGEFFELIASKADRYLCMKSAQGDAGFYLVLRGPDEPNAPCPRPLNDGAVAGIVARVPKLPMVVEPLSLRQLPRAEQEAQHGSLCIDEAGEPWVYFRWHSAGMFCSLTTGKQGEPKSGRMFFHEWRIALVQGDHRIEVHRQGGRQGDV